MRNLIVSSLCIILSLNIIYSQSEGSRPIGSRPGEDQHFTYSAAQFFHVQHNNSSNSLKDKNEIQSQFVEGKYQYKESLENIAVAKALTLTDFSLTPNENVTFELERTRSVVDANTVFQIGGKEQAQYSIIPEVYCYGGKIVNEYNSKVFFCFVGNYCFASIQRQDGSKYILGPSTESTDNSDYIIINEKDCYNQKNISDIFKPLICLTDQIPQPGEFYPVAHQKNNYGEPK